MSGSPWPRMLGAGVAVIALGYGIMKGTTPTDKQFYDSLSPELKRQVDQQHLAVQRKSAYSEQLMRAREGGDTESVRAEAARARDSTPPPRV